MLDPVSYGYVWYTITCTCIYLKDVNMAEIIGILVLYLQKRVQEDHYQEEKERERESERVEGEFGIIVLLLCFAL